MYHVSARQIRPPRIYSFRPVEAVIVPEVLAIALLTRSFREPSDDTLERDKPYTNAKKKE